MTIVDVVRPDLVVSVNAGDSLVATVEEGRRSKSEGGDDQMGFSRKSDRRGAGEGAGRCLLLQRASLERGQQRREIN